MSEHANYYQGEHVGLRLNLEGIEALSAALDSLRATYGRRGFHEVVPLRLPDGRTLKLTVSPTSDGELRDEHGDYLGTDGLAHGDVTGDLRAHIDADNAIQAACAWPLLTTAQLDGSEAVDVEALAQTQTDAALDRLNGHEYERRAEWLAGLRERGPRRGSGSPSRSPARRRGGGGSRRSRPPPVNRRHPGCRCDRPSGRNSEGEGVNRMRITVFLVLLLLVAVAPQVVVGAAQAVVDAAVAVLDGLIDTASATPLPTG